MTLRWTICLPMGALACTIGVEDPGRDWGQPPALDDDADDDASGTEAGETSGFEPGDTGGGDDEPPASTTDDGSTGVEDCAADLASDPLHCGACGHDCAGGSCLAGVCNEVMLTTNIDFPWHMRVHGGRLFIGSDGGLVTVPVEGGEKSLLAGGTVRGLVVDDARVYWIDRVAATVSSAPVGGGPPQVLADAITEPYPLDGDDTHLYWIDGGVHKLAKDGSTHEVIVAADGSGFVPWQLAVGGGRVYWRSEDGELRTTDVSGAGDTVLATGNEMRAVAVNDTHVFAMRRDGFEEIDTLLRIPIGGGQIEELIAGQPNCLPLLADADNVYWATEFGSPTQILVMPVAGGPVRIVAELQSDNAIFTVDDHVMYFADQELGTIHKLVL